MANNYALESTPQGWQFSNEAALEDFIWEHLEPLFGYQPLRRQHHVEGNYCDILAIAPPRQLVVIELKNTEDRYVVQQLTRYYHKLQEEKPFGDRVDYTQPIRLIVISPKFHEDNITDTLYHQLDFSLVSFQILKDNSSSLVFFSPEKEVLIPLHSSLAADVNSGEVIESPPAPRTFKNALVKCEKYDPDFYFNFREKILKLDSQIREIKVENRYFIYGKGKTKPLACIAFVKEKRGENIFHRPDIAFWLPISIHWSHKQERLSPLFIRGFLHPKAANFSPEEILKFQLFKKRNPTDPYMAENWIFRHYVGSFVEKELMEKVDSHDADDLSKKINRYCNLKKLPNPLKSHDDCTHFLIEVALDCWRRRL